MEKYCLPVTPGRPPELTNEGEHDKQFRHVELEINTACDLDCFGCDRFSDVTMAPNMTVAQVRLFVQESLDLRHKWERIRLLGGEPTLHPQLQEIAEAVMVYRSYHPKCFIQLLSNGLGKLSKVRDWLVYRGIDPHVEGKQKGVTPAWFRNTRMAPVDRNPGVGALAPCGIFGVRGCGIGLTRHGYFLDGAGASIARVAGLNVGVLRLKDVTWERMLEQAKVLCRLCGHWNPPNRTESQQVSETGEVMGKFWTDALTSYAKSKPTLPVYGQS